MAQLPCAQLGWAVHGTGCPHRAAHHQAGLCVAFYGMAYWHRTAHGLAHMHVVARGQAGLYIGAVVQLPCTWLCMVRWGSAWARALQAPPAGAGWDPTSAEQMP